MDPFIMQHADRVAGRIGCFDRLLFTGHLAVSHAHGALEHLRWKGVLVKDFPLYARKIAEQLKSHAEKLATECGLTVQYVTGTQRREDLVRASIAQRGVERGLAYVLSAVEMCQAFRVVPAKGRPTLRSERRKGLVHYFYVMDRELGLVFVRRPTFFPFPIQVYFNAHDWLARQMQRRGLAFIKDDNAFLSLSNFAKAQEISDRFARLDWKSILDRLTRPYRQVLAKHLGHATCYWVIEQSEYATDYVFKTARDLEHLAPEMVRQAITSYTPDDVARFMERNPGGNFKAEQHSQASGRRVDSVRIKHRVGSNWIKAYPKKRRVLRIETVINEPRDFKVRRSRSVHGRNGYRFLPMRKGVADFARREKLCKSANQRYASRLATVSDPSAARRALARMAKPVVRRGRRARGLNPASEQDLALFEAVCRGEHDISGIRNRDIRALLHPGAPASEAKRHASAIGRKLDLLRAHGYLTRIRRTHAWQVTPEGRVAMLAALRLREAGFPQAYQSAAS